MSAPMKVDRLDRVLALVLFVGTVVVVGVSAQSLGFTRDEGYYFKAGQQYAQWWQELVTHPSDALSSSSINQHLAYNPEHPFLMKGGFALSWAINKAIGSPFLQHNALRFPAWIAAGLSTVFVFLLARHLLPRRAALTASLCWIAMPHVFWHMHVACFDVAVAAGHTALIWAWLRFRHTLQGAVVVGVVFGFAGAVKHNVLPIPALLVLHWLLTEAAEKDGRLRLPVVFFSLALIAPLVYVVLWPYLWPDVGARFGQYIAFHLKHEHYPILYFGDLLTHPPFPWLFPFVMSAVTIPLPILILMGAGVVVAVVAVVSLLRARFFGARGEVEVTRVPLGRVSGNNALLLLLNAFVPFVLIALPSTPIFGGTKHWMNGLPFLCVLGAWALAEAAARLQLKQAVVVVVAAGVVLPGFLLSARVWPYGLGSYNELAGFSRGAANVGMQRTFWGYEAREALPLINERTPRGGRIHFGDVNADSHRMYGADGLLRPDIGFAGSVRGSNVAHVEPQGEFKQQQIDVWNEWQTRVPDRVIHAEGVPLSTITFRPAR
ncbi:MAG: glycosyltransferase family 39 protein [Deltaproteobacteria bacterium]|nr:glycosyltransferase family 39 protein [Deltaproteobacteria bacterium]